MLAYARTSSLRRIAQLCLVALLLLPALLGAHHHVDSSPSTDCATCVVVHHGPLATTPALSIDVPHGSISIVPTTIDLPSAVTPVTRLGRAPPHAILLSTT